MEFGEKLVARREKIKQLEKRGSDRHETIEFLGQELDLHVHRVDLGFPRYRLRNGRTIHAQEDLLSRNQQLPRDLFKDTESIEAQRAQHEILVQMVKDQPNRMLLNEMSKGHQTHALILDADGVVINGNRRLATMRMMYEEDPKKYKSFQTIRIAILPNADEREIYQFEVQEQVRPEVRARYNWLQAAKMLQRGRDELGLDERKLAAMHDSSVPAVKKSLLMLQAADAYLRDRGKPGQYHLVEKDRHAFEQIVKGRKTIKDEGKKAAATQLTYTLIEAPDSGLGRAYSYIPLVYSNVDKLVDTVRETIEIPDEDSSASNDLDLLGGGGSSSGVAEAIAQVAADPESKDRLIDVLVEEVESLQTRAKHQKKKNRGLSLVREASKKLQEAQIALNHESKFDGIVEQIDAIEKHLAKLREQVAKHAKN